MAKTSVIARNAKACTTYHKVRCKASNTESKGRLGRTSSSSKNSSPVRYKNRCGITGRAKGYLRDFGLSRIKFRELANEGKVPGVRKSSW
jgi:small subunit ribosomal protein S14